LTRKSSIPKTYYDKMHYSPKLVAKLLPRKLGLTDHWYRLLIRFIEKYNIRLQDTLVVEVGCGLGGFCRYLIKNKAPTVGIDISVSAIRYAHKVCKATNERDYLLGLIVCDARHLPFRESAFDLVVCAETLEHTHDIFSSTKELARICKMRGFVLVTAPNLIPRLYSDLLDRIAGLGQPEIMTNYLMIRRTIQATGLKIIHEEGTDFFPNLLLPADIPQAYFSELVPKRLRGALRLSRIITIMTDPQRGFWKILSGTAGFVAVKAPT